MRRIFSRLLAETEEARDVMLVTVVDQLGSAPRPAGAWMLVGAEGRLTWSIGGGAVEYAAEQLALSFLKKQRSGLHHFTLRPNANEDIGMQCGGDVDVLFAYVNSDDLRWELIAGAVCDRIESREPGWLILPADGGLPSLYGKEGLLAGEAIAPESVEALCRSRAASVEGYFAQPLPQYGRVVIFGGGHIAQALVPMLSAVDFRCVVLDDRADYAKAELFPGADEVICCDFDRIGESVTLSGEDYVVVMTNGHSHDLSVEEQVLRANYAYLGVVGSRSKIDYVNGVLRSHGIADEALATVHTPIGLSICAVTPAEIAVSILAELILCRAENRDEEGAHGCPMQLDG